MAQAIYDAGGALIGWELEHTAQQVDDAIEGLEDKADKTALEAEQTARQQADQTLQGNIEAEATARKAADYELKSALKSGSEADAIYHLGFYLDENGDLCQVEEETNNG